MDDALEERQRLLRGVADALPGLSADWRYVDYDVFRRSSLGGGKVAFEAGHAIPVIGPMDQTCLVKRIEAGANTGVVFGPTWYQPLVDDVVVH